MEYIKKLKSKKEKMFERYSKRLVFDEAESVLVTRVKLEPQTDEMERHDLKKEMDVDLTEDDHIDITVESSTLLTLYEGHEVKGEMVIGPEEIQTRNVLCDLNRQKSKVTETNIVPKEKENDNDLKCPICGKTFTLRNNCQRHISTIHRKQTYSCKVCKRTYSRKASLRHHEQIHRRTERKLKKIACEHCGKAFNDRSNRNRHRKRCPNNPTATSDKETSNTTKKVYECDLCSKRYHDKYELTRHIFSHDGIKQYTCEICPKRFTRSNNLKSHMRSHDGKRLEKCEICSKSFTRRWYLVEHVRSHDELSRQQCCWCDKQFLTSTQLKQHQQFCNETVCRQKPFACDVCKKRFADKKTISKHIASNHLEQFTCNHCHKSFGSRKNILKHMRLECYKSKYRCKFCEKQFVHKKNLNLHERSHSGIRSYTCEICGKSYIYRSNLIQHKKLHTSL